MIAADHSTPGPWVIQPCQANHGETTLVVAPYAGYKIICEIRSNAWDEKAKLSRDQRRDRENARLIASAPRMRALLEYFYDFAVLNDDGEDQKFAARLRKAQAILRQTGGKV